MYSQFGLIKDSKSTVYEKFNFKISELKKLENVSKQFLKQGVNHLGESVKISKMNLVNIPLSLMDSRDCFVFDPIVEEEIVSFGPGGENVIKKTFYFGPDVLPDNYDNYIDKEAAQKDENYVKNYKNLRVGCTCYENFFTNEEM